MILKIIGVIVIAIILILMFPQISNKFDKLQESQENCTLDCIKDTLDNFDECIDLGFENTGFLSSEHYYLCDGIKVTNTCLEWKETSDNCWAIHKRFKKEIK